MYKVNQKNTQRQAIKYFARQLHTRDTQMNKPIVEM